ncbi:acetaldehyde dehydrogenase (acetylating) [Neorhizobium sp. CSC1952]|uniref:acetaldehyde dehydrogenase (acetylating) n=1 Tax=Neorhizobium sp. CSC1952 TaxID=2978974 RepID=UPI0025A5DD24|nr:acetaldehyde dehydrogenase (acetylating) [Rhizobium sp. CSC1952]WJR65843.1 acetaldehyde dehydrogenase (acetylating) [Rhizobium sp. CSC1952]
MTKTKVAIMGSGNIGTDLMIKVLRSRGDLEMAALVGVDPKSDGLARAGRLDVATTAEGLDGLRRMRDYADIGVVFDATSAGAHKKHSEKLAADGKIAIDLTPAAVGPFVIPSVNIDEHISSQNVNMVTCGGQATVPIVAALSRVAPVPYAEIVASISSRSAGPGTRANIDEFTETTSHAIEVVGGARRGKAIIILNPAEPPLMMRDTVFALMEAGREEKVRASVKSMVEEVQKYVPGYRLKQDVQFDDVGGQTAVKLGAAGDAAMIKVTVFLEVEGAAHYLPAYAGNLDIMTSAALRTAEHIVQARKELAI